MPHTKFALVGAASAENLSKEEARLIDWLHAGYSGDMKFLSRDPHKRCDPRLVLPKCKTVIVAAMRFEDMPVLAKDFAAAATSRNDSSERHCELKRTNLPLYLTREDYHAVMTRELNALVKALREKHPNAEFKCYVDTGPVLEKAWAVRAGLGFIGKNTLFISPKFGSQLALGVVLTTAEVATVKPPVALRNSQNCGECRACIDACPEKALVAPFKLDARRCRSYKFFIEKKIGGCDICQNVCPFNKTTLEDV